MERNGVKDGGEAGDFILHPFRPAYASLPAGELDRRAQAAVARLADCRCCPRECGINRLRGETGFCRTGRHAHLSSAFAHGGEEDCLRGWFGSGTLFFGQCNLRCAFCQNWTISQGEKARESKPKEVAGAMLALQSKGCHNVNLVTPTHVVPQLMEAIARAARAGLHIPVVYNSGGYESVETLKLLEGLVDIYMPDFKFWEEETARDLSNAPDYPSAARAALAEMHRQVGELKFGPDGLARRGLLVRHLVMPGLGGESANIMKWIAETLSSDTYINIMGQYRPEHRMAETADEDEGEMPELKRRPTGSEMARAFAAARAFGLWRFDGGKDVFSL